MKVQQIVCGAHNNDIWDLRVVDWRSGYDKAIEVHKIMEWCKGEAAYHYRVKKKIYASWVVKWPTWHIRDAFMKKNRFYPVIGWKVMNDPLRRMHTWPYGVASVSLIFMLQFELSLCCACISLPFIQCLCSLQVTLISFMQHVWLIKQIKIRKNGLWIYNVK